MKITYLIIILSFFIIGCNQQNKKDKKNEITKQQALSDETYDLCNNNEEENEIMEQQNQFGSNVKKVLEKQLKKGMGVYDELSELEDLKATVLVVDSILLKNGYVKPSEQEFKKKVKTIFNKDIDMEKNGFAYFSGRDPCDTNLDELKKLNGRLVIANFDGGGFKYNYVYIYKDYPFLTYAFYLPEILNYKKIYPELLELEEVKVLIPDDEDFGNEELVELKRWKDIEKLPKERYFNQRCLIHINKYLFNDSNDSRTWLMVNDPEFLETLVMNFGYVKDKQMLKWVLDRNKYQFIVNDSPEDFTRILIHRNCEGKIIFHQEVLDIMTENLNDDYVHQIADYTTALNTPNDSEMSRTISSLSFEEFVEFSAHLLYWGELLVQDEYREYAYYFMRSFVRFNDYEIELKKNNYYDLKGFKELWEMVKEGENIIRRDGGRQSDDEVVSKLVPKNKKPKMLGGHILVDPY
jgi:hypothetical protein